MNKQNWSQFFIEESKKPYYSSLMKFVKKEREGSHPIYPKDEDVFNAFNKTPYDDVRVVIVGQDPYHGPGQAHGLCFSVQKGVPKPPSLQNIFKELRDDVGFVIPEHGCLQGWAEQGVFLLNTMLTVRGGQPMSHAKQGWEQFTDHVIAYLSQREDPLVFVLWGKAAQDKFKHAAVETSQHLVLKSVHPSPLSAYNGFLGSKPFSKINEFLVKHHKTPIDWQI